MMTPSDAVEGLSQIVSRGHAAVTVLMDELQGSLAGPFEVRPVVDESTDVWAQHLSDALGEVRGRVVAITSERPGLAARIALALAARLVDTDSPVTIVDGSIEEPVFAKGLPEDGDEGLVDAVLFGVSSSTVARRTLMHGVRLVTAGSYPISVPAVLGADAYATTLQKLAREDATVLLVLPAAYASVAAAAASQLIIASRDLAELERMSRELRSAEDLGDVRFVAALSAPEPVPVAEAESAAADGAFTDEGAASGDESPVGGDALFEEEPAPVEEEPAPVEEEPAPVEEERAPVGDADDEVTPEPAAVTVQTAARRDGTAPQEARTPSSRRWGVPVTIIVILILAGVAWRSGVIRQLFPVNGDGRVEVASMDETTTSLVEEGDAVDEGTVDDGTVDAASEAVDERMGEEAAAGETAAAPERVAPGDWRSLATFPAIPGQYVVFTSSHRREAAARRDADTLEGRGFQTTVVLVDVPERGTWHRVAVDAGFRTLDDTRELLDIMREVGYEGAWVERLRAPAPRETPPEAAPAVDEPVNEPAADQAAPDTAQRWIDGND